MIVISLPINNPYPGEQELALMAVALGGLESHNDGLPVSLLQQKQRYFAAISTLPARQKRC